MEFYHIHNTQIYNTSSSSSSQSCQVAVGDEQLQSFWRQFWIEAAFLFTKRIRGGVESRNKTEDTYTLADCIGQNSRLLLLPGTPSSGVLLLLLRKLLSILRVVVLIGGEVGMRRSRRYVGGRCGRRLVPGRRRRRRLRLDPRPSRFARSSAGRPGG